MEKHKYVIIRPAHNVGRVMVLDKEFYHKHMLEPLSDRSTYKKLGRDSTIAYREQLMALIGLARDIRFSIKRNTGT